MMLKKRKKKGRPSLVEIQKRNLLLQQQHTSSSSSNLTRPSNPHHDDDDERKQKKVKLVVPLLGRSDDDQGEKGVKVTDSVQGAGVDSGPTTPLPDKKLLVFILDRLQKKDRHGVFSEPVDPDELPDYHEIIEHPMDFGTVRKKLEVGLYSNLEELETDVFLICSNAMQYNPSYTVFFRQAQSIQELAKRDFENLRHEGDDGELQPKVVRRGRPPGKQQKKPSGSSSADRIGPELSTGVTLATEEENTMGSNAYNLRKAPMMSKFLSADMAVNTHRSRNGEKYSEWLADWNDEFPGYILRADMKYGKKHFTIDETRRHTYKQFHPSTSSHEPTLLSDLDGDTKQLMPVGLTSEHSYARSLARFAANLGPVAWKVASKKLESVLPPGMKFGPGFVGENEAPPESPFSTFEEQRISHKLASNGSPGRPVTGSTAGVNREVVPRFPGKDSMPEVDKRLNSQELVVHSSPPFSGTESRLTFQNQHDHIYHSDTNSFNGVFREDIPSRMGLVGEQVLTGQSGPGDALFYPQTPALIARMDSTLTQSRFRNITDSGGPDYSDSLRMFQSDNRMTPDTCTDLHDVPEVRSSSRQSWQASFPHPRSYSFAVQPNLNVELQGQGSPSSRLGVGSPQQPDLALQL
ncbi:Bromodomain-containing protein 9-like [Heracleum sosnowskyi]|uniref:Bromodomain-containing protein 9-like n=1 Tax=Heracleum sosnowskyi TaxID=360622 RepID=A0AAD8MXF8_9APIA|nr:Bromodomain-containing protein 9-like [Heracleum sosnowskyi]